MQNQNTYDCSGCGTACSNATPTCPKCGNAIKPSPANMLAYIVIFFSSLVLTFWILGAVF